MRGFLLTAFATLTVASPDIGLLLRQQQQGLDGYEYQPQQHNHQLNNYLPLFHQQQGYDYQQQYNYQENINIPSNAASSSAVPEDNYVAKAPNKEQSNKNSVAYQAPTKTYFPSIQVNQNIGQSFENNDGFNSPLIQEPIITKHVYFHAAPEEDEQPEVLIREQIVAPQKHYKIIFIKAPSNGISQDIQVPAPPQTEEKTIVYVLSKKQESIDVKYEKPAPLVPSKPEVFFIKYKTQKEAITQEKMAIPPTITSSNQNAVEAIKRPLIGGSGGFSSGSSGPALYGPPPTIISNLHNNNYLTPYETLNTKTAHYQK